MYVGRTEKIKTLFPDIQTFRFAQIQKAFFDVSITGWSGITTLSLQMREAIQSEKIPWTSVTLLKLYESAKQDTFKAVLKVCDNYLFETVLMANKRGQWTICVSSQIGCAMRCSFCATGTMGLKRSLHSDEIIDQYRFWQQYLTQHPNLPQRISNIVFMGMGEPLANYEHVKKAIHTWLTYTDLGPTKIMISTVGILNQMKKLLTDPDWPDARIAISLHSPNQQRRAEIVPTTTPNFIRELAEWSHAYHSTLGNRRHRLTFEYTLISGVNDTPELAQELAKYMKQTVVEKINVIPYNPVVGKKFIRADRTRIDTFKKILLDLGVDVVERRTMGEDIGAACGQLALANEVECKQSDVL